jgi:hypothetical protein
MLFRRGFEEESQEPAAEEFLVALGVAIGVGRSLVVCAGVTALPTLPLLSGCLVALLLVRSKGRDRIPGAEEESV